MVEMTSESIVGREGIMLIEMLGTKRRMVVECTIDDTGIAFAVVQQDWFLGICSTRPRAG